MKVLETKLSQHSPVPLIGRILLSAIFLLSAFGKATAFSGTAQWMASVGFPAPALFLTGAIAFEVVGGLAVLLGYHARIGALALILFLIPTTVIFHNFWAVAGPEAQTQMINFLKNLAILGGLGYVVQYGAGTFSLDAWRARRQLARQAADQDFGHAVHSH